MGVSGKADSGSVHIGVDQRLSALWVAQASQIHDELRPYRTYTDNGAFTKSAYKNPFQLPYS